LLYIPGVAELNLVADLDRVMTVEKAVVAEWERKSGCLVVQKTPETPINKGLSPK